MSAFEEAMKHFGGMYGSAWQDGFQLLEIVEVSPAVDINRIEIPMVGSTKVGYKAGRETREGTLTAKKLDSRWEKFVFQFLNQTLAQRRAVRGTAQATLREFTLKLEYDDPDTPRKEVWQLEGCKIWRMQPGAFSITDDYVQREYPLTWESEEPIETWQYDRATGAVQVLDSTES
jgi:hypothetical protein